ncbi:GNAT family N-acetyltransferase [Cryobacterium sp. TMS1-13-1]|uniref:GNAT family N-acetyltransferase n=1 Tax=Cryobacterium sp. TMS1-13-1 TaxID=1259220 RepID=UPI00106A5CE5|nr:GNAT family N-acetyltransferase [Cryobacterium sp. TMS1-13-1]TFD23644.1 N-acetyltransferase [Cryobacterium sp. TMS1-13-1]
MPRTSIQPIETERLRLEPLAVEHAPAMGAVLSDSRLYEFTGGTAPTRAQLESRYAAQAAGRSDDGSEWWLNWIVVDRSTGDPTGFVQATVRHDDGALVADIAWVISTRYQGHGIASEATRAMVDWLTGHKVARFTAHIHPDHQASSAVARKQGLHPTDTHVDGERRWES